MGFNFLDHLFTVLFTVGTLCRCWGNLRRRISSGQERPRQRRCVETIVRLACPTVIESEKNLNKRAMLAINTLLGA
jgi:hypothetical protein